MEQLLSEPTKKFLKGPQSKGLFWLNSLLLFFISIYRAFLGGYFGGSCRFSPSCSEYAVEVLQTQRPLRAISLISRRILSCRPFGRMGYDPAPLKHRTCEENCNE